jgi:hypothetical protein
MRVISVCGISQVICRFVISRSRHASDIENISLPDSAITDTAAQFIATW